MSLDVKALQANCNHIFIIQRGINDKGFAVYKCGMCDKKVSGT